MVYYGIIVWYIMVLWYIVFLVLISRPVTPAPLTQCLRHHLASHSNACHGR